LVSRAHFQHLSHFVSQLCLTLRAGLHMRIPPFALVGSRIGVNAQPDA
jgi:hypothetical protein